MPRTKSDAVDYDPNEETVFVETGDLADLAMVSKSWIFDAARNDWLAAGLPVANWRVEDRYGQTAGFDVPKSVFNKLREARKYRDE